MLKCCVCGFASEKSILRHIRTEHGMSASEYRAKYDSPVRIAWVKSSESAMESFRAIGRRNKELLLGKPGRAKLAEGKWSREYDQCVECGRTEWKHLGKGLCQKCWLRMENKKITENKNNVLLSSGKEDIDYVICQLCGKPFEYLSSEGHLKKHGITSSEYLVRFPESRIKASIVSEKQGLGISRSRIDLMKRRGYLNPQSQRDKKRKEMSLRHATSDFSKVSKIESTVADWFLGRGYMVAVGSDECDGSLGPIVRWQFHVMDKYCVDFANENKKVIVEVLGDWWHGWEIIRGTQPYEKAHAKVKRNMYLDKIRFLDLESSGWKVFKIWEHQIKDGTFSSILGEDFPDLGNQIKTSPSALLARANPTTNSVKLSEIAVSHVEKWNSRWLISSGAIRAEKSMLSREEALKLRNLLDQAGDKSLIPQEIIDKEFNKARSKGFPFPIMTRERMVQEWNSLRSFEPKEPYLWDGHGTNLATLFHPHMFECRHPRKMSAMEFFSSDQALRRGIEKILCLYGPDGVNDSTIREICRNEAASSRINNFPPRVAKSIIKFLVGDNRKARVLDPCAGFSGRLIGVSSCGLEYNGIDLSPHTYDGLKRTDEFVRTVDPSARIRIIHGDCLDVMPTMDERFELVITSPPFLDMEQYKDVPFQTNYQKWHDSFVRPFILSCANRLVEGGILALYLERIRSRDFPRDVVLLAESAGLKTRNPVTFRMSYGENNRGNTTMRTANVLIFTK